MYLLAVLKRTNTDQQFDLRIGIQRQRRQGQVRLVTGWDVIQLSYLLSRSLNRGNCLRCGFVQTLVLYVVVSVIMVGTDCRDFYFYGIYLFLVCVLSENGYNCVKTIHG